MKPRVALLLLAFVVMAVPVFAQGPPAIVPEGGLQSLARDLAALTARVAKLEGNIETADLAGTWSLVLLSTTMDGVHPGFPGNASIETSGARGTLILNTDLTGSVTSFACEGAKLNLGTRTMSGVGCGEPEGSGAVTWAYADGVLAITFVNNDEDPDDDETLPLNVGAGGRLGMTVFAPFHPSDPSSNQVLFIATRLR